MGVFSFLCGCVGRHFPIVPPAELYFRAAAGNACTVDLERLMEASDESEMQAGAHTARDLNWKEGLDAFTCTECGRCKDACPTALTDKPLSLKMVNDALKHHLVAERAAIVDKTKPPLRELPPLVGPVIADETLWACTTCGYCEAACLSARTPGQFFRCASPRL